MNAPHEILNAAPAEDARSMLLRCCGSVRWAEAMLARRPFGSTAELHQAAETLWNGLAPDDWLEAFRHHPRIGDTGAPPALGPEDDSAHPASEWSRQEQSAVQHADAATLRALREANAAYERRFGFVFLVCATGKSAEEMLRSLDARINNEPTVELRVASREQAKITRLRMEKLQR